MAADRSDVSAGLPGSGPEPLDTSGPGRRTAWGSLLSAQDFAAIASVGFRPVGHVLGAAVVHLGYVSRGGRCSGTGSYASRTDLASAQSGPFNLLLRKRYGVRHQALSRALEQCRALGADGVVGLSLSVRPFPAGGTEFTMQGTAIRARTEIRPATPFTSHLSAPEFARLLRGGFVPTSLVFGISLGARHDDLRTRKQTRWKADNEVRSYSELIRDTRRDTRIQLEKAVAAEGADGVVVNQMTLEIGERECPSQEGTRDHVAEAAILGTTIVCFHRSPAADDRVPLTIMHLTGAPVIDSERLPNRVPQPPPGKSASEGGLLDRLASAWAARRASRSSIAYGDSAGISKKSD